MNRIEQILDRYAGDEISWVGRKVRANAWKSILCAFAVGWFCNSLWRWVF